MLRKPETNDTNYINAMVDTAEALSKVFKRYSRKTRKEAWNSITSKDGKKEVEKLMVNPDRSLSQFRTIRKSFAEWAQEN